MGRTPGSSVGRMQYHMPDTRTELTDDGLRFRSKVAGSPFPIVGTALGATMSCWLCGHHVPRSRGAFRRLAGSKRFVCAEHMPAPARSTEPA